MEKQIIIGALNRLIQDISDLRDELLNDSQDQVTFPTYYNQSITELYLDNRNPEEPHNVPTAVSVVRMFQQACAEHNVYTIGQLIQIGRASVSKWPGIPPRIIRRVSRELSVRFNVNW